jgi:hypothetical protein
MRVSIGALALALATLGSVSALEGQQLREDSYRWYMGAQGGGLWFETQTQTSTMVPVGGLQALIVGKRGGLMLSWEEAFGDNEESAFGDATAPNGTREVTFDRLRKYSATLMAFPLRSRFEPYLGVGFGILHTVGTEVSGFFTTPEEAATATETAKNKGSTGFGSFVGGVQYRISPIVTIYGHYQITTAPKSGNLLVGPSHTLIAGVRFGLGNAKEGIRGGGY